MKIKEQPNKDLWLIPEDSDPKVIRFPMGCDSVIHHQNRDAPNCFEFRFDSGHKVFIYENRA